MIFRENKVIFLGSGREYIFSLVSLEHHFILLHTRVRIEEEYI